MSDLVFISARRKIKKENPNLLKLKSYSTQLHTCKRQGTKTTNHSNYSSIYLNLRHSEDYKRPLIPSALFHKKAIFVTNVFSQIQIKFSLSYELI